MITVLPTSAPLRRVSSSGKQFEEHGMPMRRPEYGRDFARRRMSKSYARNAWKQIVDNSNDLTDLQLLDEQDALIVEGEEVVVLEPVVAAVPPVNIVALLDVDENDDGKLKDTIGIDKIERVRVKCKLLELQKQCRDERQTYQRLSARRLRWLTCYLAASVHKCLW